MTKKIGEAKVKEGYTAPVLSIPSDIEKGEHTLTAKYLQNEHYDTSFDQGKIYLGNKVYMYCPTVYTYPVDEISLTAYIFAGGKKVNYGNGILKLNGITMTDKLQATDGLLQSQVSYSITKNATYQAVYEGSVSQNLTPARATGNIQVIQKQGIPIIVEVNNLIATLGETVLLTARVYNKEYGGAVNENDIPKGGRITFVVDNVTIGMITISSTGFAQIEYTPYKEGVHEVIAYFTPSDEIKKYYTEMAGSGVLYAYKDTDKPKLTETSTPRGRRGNVNTLSLTSDTTLNGEFSLFIDNQKVAITNSKVSNSKTFTTTFNIPLFPSPSILWAYAGQHIRTLVYTTTSGQTYYYTLPTYFLLCNTNISIVIEDSVNEMIMVGDKIEFEITDEYGNNVPNGELELVFSENITPDWYNDSLWVNATISNNTVINSAGKTTYFTQYPISKLQKISFTSNQALRGFPTIGIYNPTTDQWIGIYYTGRYLRLINNITGDVKQISNQSGNMSGTDVEFIIEINNSTSSLQFTYLNDKDEYTTQTVDVYAVNLSEFYLAVVTVEESGVLKNFTLKKEDE